MLGCCSLSEKLVLLFYQRKSVLGSLSEKLVLLKVFYKRKSALGSAHCLLQVSKAATGVDDAMNREGSKKNHGNTRMKWAVQIQQEYGGTSLQPVKNNKNLNTKHIILKYCRVSDGRKNYKTKDQTVRFMLNLEHTRPRSVFFFSNFQCNEFNENQSGPITQLLIVYHFLSSKCQCKLFPKDIIFI